MDFSKRQADPRRHMVGIAVVILFHALIVYALVTGLAKKVVQVVIAPIETKVIEEVRKPPPPEVVVPPPPKLEAPPPPFIPPPEVQITAPPPPQPTITATTPTPPPAPVVIAPAPPVAAPPAAVAAPPAPPAPPAPKPAIQQAGVACSKMVPPEPPALNTEVQGSVFVLATLKAGRVVQVEIERDTLRGVADRRAKRAIIASIENAMKDGYQCAGDAVQIRQEFFFDIK